jgi:2-C-methyl-D-erythritol 4-phosphate cytidylyltransferase
MPKQYLSIAGETLLAHSLRPLLACAQIERIALVLQAGDQWAQDTGILQQDKIHRVDGGLARSDSVLAGLEYLSESFAEDDWVLVHDAARPCLGAQDIEDLIEKVCDSGVGGILAQPIADTVKLAGDNATVESTVDRSRLWRRTWSWRPGIWPLVPMRKRQTDAYWSRLRRTPLWRGQLGDPGWGEHSTRPWAGSAFRRGRADSRAL